MSFFGGMPLKIYFVRRTQHGKRDDLLFSDIGFAFLKAWEIGSRRWALEVVLKDRKANLGLCKSQSTCCASHIAAATLRFLQYYILWLQMLNEDDNGAVIIGIGWTISNAKEDFFNSIKEAKEAYTLAEKIPECLSEPFDFRVL